MLPRYIVKPSGNGFTLTGPDLPYALRFTDEITAGSMAHHLGRITGGRVIYLSRSGHPIITETIAGGIEPTGATPLDHGQTMLEAKRSAFGSQK